MKSHAPTSSFPSQGPQIRLSTTVKSDLPQRRARYYDTIAGIGSCFSQFVLEHLSQRGMNVAWNPCGIVYNAVSVEDSICRIVDERLYCEEDFFRADGLWHCWELHGSLSSPDLAKAVSRANDILHRFRDKLSAARLFALTPSSSVVYRLRANGRIVSNCHKMPSHTFDRMVLTSDENHAALSGVIEAVRKLNPDCVVVVSLSPVRHYPGDLILNTLSKANLVSAIHDCIDYRRDIYYFPSYEIQLDELRDYRFYNDDLLHPSDLARRIILERFVGAYFDEEAQSKIADAEAGVKARGHRPFHSPNNG